MITAGHAASASAAGTFGMTTAGHTGESAVIMPTAAKAGPVDVALRHPWSGRLSEWDRSAAVRVEVEAERVPGRVEDHPHRILGEQTPAAHPPRAMGERPTRRLTGPGRYAR